MCGHLQWMAVGNCSSFLIRGISRHTAPSLITREPLLLLLQPADSLELLLKLAVGVELAADSKRVTVVMKVMNHSVKAGHLLHANHYQQEHQAHSKQHLEYDLQ